MIMRHARIRLLSTGALALACGILTIARPDWSAVLRAQSYDPPCLCMTPDTLRFPASAVGAVSGAGTFTLTNDPGSATSIGPFIVHSVAVEGRDSGDFAIAANRCAGKTLASKEACTIDVTFKPTALGPRHASVVANGTQHGMSASATGNLAGGEPGCMTADPKGLTDEDEDGLLYCWETEGLDANGDGTPDLDLKALGADPSHKDIFIEIDYMKSPTHTHNPLLTPDGKALSDHALRRVASAFRFAPVANPDGKDGIALHYVGDRGASTTGIVDEELPEVEVLLLTNPSRPQNLPQDGFNRIKLGAPENPCGVDANTGHFGTPTDRKSTNCRNIIAAKRLVFRYGVFGHNYEFNPIWDKSRIGSSGMSKIRGGDFIVSLAVKAPASAQGNAATDFERRARTAAEAFKASGATFDHEWTDIVAATFMHELGHTLGLLHGGHDGVNCKPNYLSVMSYSRQFNDSGFASDLPDERDCIAVPGTATLKCRINRRLDYYSGDAQRQLPPPLVESSLEVENGVRSTPGERVLFGGINPELAGVPPVMLGVHRVGPSRGRIDWDGNGPFHKVASDINFLKGNSSCGESPGQTLTSHDDWAYVESHLRYRFADRQFFSGGGGGAEDYDSTPEQNDVDYLNGVLGGTDFDNDQASNTEDNCPLVFNPDQTDTDGNTVGDACEAPAQLAVSHRASPERVANGSTVTFVTNVLNSGSVLAKSIVVTATLPAATTFESCTTSIGGICGGSGTRRMITIDSLPPGATATISIVARVDCDVADQTELSSTTEVTFEPHAADRPSILETATATALNSPPEIAAVSADPPTLWPVSHKMVSVTVGYDAVDSCGTATCSLSVETNEPFAAGERPDWEIVDAHHVRLRSERSGSGDGRRYTITITCTDSAGGVSRRHVTVVVPHDRSAESTSRLEPGSTQGR